MPYDYRDVLDQYDMLKDAGVVTESLPKWSRRKNLETGTDAYSAGEDDNFVKRASVAIDRFLESTGLPTLTEPIGRYAGRGLEALGLEGAEEESAELGRKLPRIAANLAPMALSVLGPAGVAAGLAGTAALSGGETYTETGSPAAGLISGGVAAAMPGIGNIARREVLKRVGAKEITGTVVSGVDKLLRTAGIGDEEVTRQLVGRLAAGAPKQMVKEYLPQNIGQRLAGYAGEQAAGSLLSGAGDVTAGYFGGPGYEFSPTTELLNMTVGQLPFAAWGAVRHGRAGFGGKAAQVQEAKLQKSVELSENAIEQHRLNEETTARTPFMDVPETPEQIAVREARVTKLVDLREKQRLAKADGTTVAEEERQKLSDEDNLLFREQGRRAGHILGVPIESIPKRPLADPASPLEDPVIKLNTAEQRLAAAKDNVDFQDSIVEVNEVRQRYGLAPIDDVEISLRQSRFGLGSDRDSVQSHIDETRRLATAKEEGKALGVEIELKRAELLHADPIVRAAAMDRLNEIDASSDTLNNTKVIADGAWTRHSAPIKSFQHEQAARITESVPETTSGDQQKFLDWASGGVNALREKHGMSLEDAGNFFVDPTVASWRGRLEMQVKDGLELSDYAQRHLMNQGVLETEAAQKAAVVTELAAKPDLIGNLLAVPAEGAEAKRARAELDTFLASDPEYATNIFAEQKVSNADELYDNLIKKGEVDEESLIYLDDKITDYIYAKAREHKQLADVLEGTDTTEFVSRPMEDPDVVLKPLQKITDAERKQAKLVGEALGMGGVAPRTFLGDVASGVHGETLAKAYGVANAFGNIWKTPTWLARFGPIWQEFSSKGYQLSPNIRKMSMEAFKAFGTDEQGRFSKKFTQAIRDKQVTGALGKWMGINQRRGQEGGVRVVDVNDPEVAKIFEGLPEEKHRLVRELMARQVISTKKMFELQLGKMLQTYSAEGVKLLNEKESGFKYDKNLKLSSAMLELTRMQEEQTKAYEVGKVPSQEELMKVQAMEQQLQMQFVDKPQLFTDLRTMMGEKLLEYNEQKGFFDANPAWATEQRYGKYTFTYQKGNKTIRDSADSRSEANEIAGGNQIKSWDLNPDHDNTPVKFERKIPLGMEDARWFDNHITWLNKNATYWSRALFRAESDAVLTDQETSGRPDLKRLALQHRDNMLGPDPKFGQWANRHTSMWYLGFNPASAMANATQLMIRGASEMSKLTGNPITSYKRIIGSYKEMYDMWMPGGKGLTEEKKKIVQRLERDGISTVTDDWIGKGDEDSGVELKRMLAGRGPLKDTASNLSRVYKDVGMYMFRKMERVNNIGAVFAAYDYYRSKGLDYENSYQQALQFNRSVNDVGGKANRPIDVMSGTGEVSKSLGLMATSLQTYNIGSIGQIVHYIKEGFLTPKDLKPAEKYHYKMALANLLGAQVAAAGILGMPFVGTLIGLIDQLFPAANVGKNIRAGVNSTFAKLIGDDEEDGGVLADMALLGVPSNFGWDMQSRLSMASPVAGVDEVNGFQPELLFGVPVNLAGKFIRGGIEAAQGKTSYVGNMMPPILKRQLDLFSSGGKVHDYNGKPILDQPTPGQKVGLFLGLQPTEASELSKANRAENRLKAQHIDEDHIFSQEQAQYLIEKADFGGIRKAVKAKMVEKQEAGIDYDWEAAMRKIASTAEEQYFVKDFRRDLSSKDKALAKHFKVPMGEPTEADRSRFKEWALTNLGVQYKPRDRVKYELMDQIERENPGVYNKTEKRRLAEKAMGKVKKVPELL